MSMGGGRIEGRIHGLGEDRGFALECLPDSTVLPVGDGREVGGMKVKRQMRLSTGGGKEGSILKERGYSVSK